MGISDLISSNKYLKFIDAASGSEFTYDDLYQNDFEYDAEKKLVFLYLDTSIASVSVLLSFLKSKHCIALLSPQLHLDFKLNLEAIYKPNLIIDSTRSEVEEYVTKSTRQFSYFVSSVSKPIQIAKPIKLLLSTSGTTGSPKFVKLSEENSTENANSIISYLPINNQDVTPLMLPLYYAYGFSIFSTNCIKGGKIICSVKDIMNKQFWEEFDKYLFTSLSGVPFFYEMLNRTGFTKHSYPSLRYMTQAGGKMNEKLIATFAEYANQSNILFYIMYGQTEATARMSYLSPEFLRDKMGSIGRPILKGSFSIDPKTEELQYTGPNVYGGYAENIDDLKEFNESKILYTGDMARVDEDGFYYITGRIKRMIKIFGNRINLDEVEHVLKNEFNNSTFVCIGLEDKNLLVATDNENLISNVVVSFLSSHLNMHPSVIKFVVLETLPSNANGKIDYNSIKLSYGIA